MQFWTFRDAERTKEAGVLRSGPAFKQNNKVYK